MAAPLSNSHPARPAGEWLVDLCLAGRRAQRLLAAAASRHALRDGELMLLLQVERGATEGGSQAALAAALAVSPAQVSGLVERLRQRGLLEGCRAADDRRRQLWRLTALGRETLVRVRGELAAPGEGAKDAQQAEAHSTLAKSLRDLAAQLAEPSHGAPLRVVHGEGGPA